MKNTYQFDNGLRTVWGKIDKNVKVAFFTSFITGLLVHAFMLANKIPNHDDLYVLFNNNFNFTWDLSLGRWFTMYPSAISSTFSMPWVNGLLAIIYISIAVCFVVSCFQINQKTTCALIACLFVTFPVVSSTMLYMWMSDVNFFSVMLACLAAYLAARFKYGYLIAIIPLTLSMGVYQAYFAVTTGLLILILIVEVLHNKVSWQETFFKGLRFIVTLGVSMIAYLYIVKLTTPPSGLSPHLGINNIGRIPISEIPAMIVNAYIRIVSFFIFDERNLHNYAIMNYLFLFSVLACAVLLVLWIIKKELYKDKLKLSLLLLLLALYPLGCNIVYLFGATTVRNLMIYATVLIPVLLLVVMDLFMSKKEPEGQPGGQVAGQARTTAVVVNLSFLTITATVVLSIFNYFIWSNQVYFKQYFAYEKGYAQHTALVSRIQSLEGYRSDMSIVLVGRPYPDNGTPEMRGIRTQGVKNDLFEENPHMFLRRYINVTQPIYWLLDYEVVDKNLVHDVAEAGEIERQMPGIIEQLPYYPDYGSVCIIDGRIYVRFSDYT